jgi:hypothetical protein
VRGPSRIDVFLKFQSSVGIILKWSYIFRFVGLFFLNNIYPSILIPDVLRFTAML